MSTTSELRQLSVDELNNELVELRKERFNYQLQKTTGQLTQTHHLKRVTKKIARVKTLLSEKKRSEQ